MTACSETVRLIGVTGGIGCGKSSIARFLASRLCLPLIDIDGICKGLLGKGEPGWHLLRKNLAPDFFTVDGSLDRRHLRTALFQDAELRMRLDSLIHPLALQAMQDSAVAGESKTILVDVPLLYEAGWAEYFRRVIVVYAPACICRERLVLRDAISPGEAARSIASQMSLAEKVMLADHVIDNSGCRLFARQQAAHLATLLQQECSAC